MKMKVKLAKFNFVAKFKKGALHTIPDALSQAPARDPRPDDIIINDKEDRAQHEYIINAAAAAIIANPDDKAPDQQHTD